jgi:hypothetical protein
MSFAVPVDLAAIQWRNPTVEARHAVGEKSIKLLEILADYNSKNERSISLGWRAALRGELTDILANYSKPGWDGESADPISVNAATVANSIIDSLPDNVIPPELTPEPNGRISIDWNLGKNRMLSVSIGDEYIAYAAIVGLRRYHGQTELQYELPKEVCEILPGYFARDSR